MNRRELLAGIALFSVPTLLPRVAEAQTQGLPVVVLPTPQFIVMANRGGMFLEESSRIAFEKTGVPAVRRFARAEVIEQVRLSEALGANADIPTASVGGVTSNPVGGALVGAGVGALVAGPVGAAVGAGVGATTGTITAGAAGAAPMMTTDAQKAAMLAQLQSLPAGPELDAAYVNAQIMGHQEAFAIYGGYAQGGEDPVLRRIAARQAVPLIRLHLSQLNRLAG